MKKIKIDFERGGSFIAELLEKDAPKTCEEVWNHLPFELEVSHTMASGRGVFGYPEFTVPPENQRVLGITPGTLLFLPKNPPLKIPNEIIIVYGIFATRSTSAAAFLPANVFAEIRGNLKELSCIGDRIWHKGTEKASFNKVED